MSYDNLVTDILAQDLVPGDTFVSPDWVYAFIVVDPVKMGFTPEPNKVYCWSLVEDMAAVLVHGQTVKKLKMYHYTFED